jgi:hypothetical protein
LEKSNWKKRKENLREPQNNDQKLIFEIDW